MSKYLAVFNISWQSAFIYRLNFTLWRVRSVLQLLLVYFIWWTVFQSNKQIFGYSEGQMLTYIMVSALIRAVILSSRVIDVSGHINQGDIVNFLVKPLNIIGYYFSRDLSDKLLNISFVVFEIALLTLILKPQLILQTNPTIVILFFLAAILGVILYFAIAFTIGLLAFWVENNWGPFFLMSIFLEGFGGGLYPIDILPKGLAQILLLTPFPYLIYFPAKLYLGSMSGSEIAKGFAILIFWVVATWLLMYKILQMGLKYYRAEGH